MPWFDWYRAAARRAGLPSADGDPEETAEQFMLAMIGERLWNRLPRAFRAERRAEGPTLRADLALTSSPGAVLDFAALTVPVVAGSGSESDERFRRSATTLVEEAPHAVGVEVPGAGHGAHLTHPQEYGGFARLAFERVERVH
jgi:pimeloyl-ACP methyl ester carboxylesterase